MTAPSLPRETSLHRNRDASLRYSVASLLTYLVSRSIVATKRLSQETIFFRLSLCFFACCSTFPKSSAFLRERSGRSAFRELSRQSPFQGIFLFYQQLLPKTASFPLVSSLFCLLRRFSQKTLFAGKPRLSLHFKDDRESAALFSPAPANKTLSARRTANLKK